MTELSPPAPPPPAPPPPPPPPVSLPSPPTKPEAGGIVMEGVDTTHYMYVGQLGVHEYRLQREREGKQGDDSNVIFLSYYRVVTPIIQQGPLCGLVAAAMAAPLVEGNDVTTEKLLKTAVDLGYTKQGEMFSAANMCRLVQSVVNDPVKSEVVVSCEESKLLEFLLQGDLLLIPYDADKNHSPCLKKGHKAHWMLITGCCLAVNDSKKIINLPVLEESEDYYVRDLYHLKPDKRTTAEILHTLRQSPDSIVGVFVYGHQGKSRHTGVWTMSELLASNQQLKELGPDRDTENYVVPDGGLETGLCAQIVRIFGGVQS